MEFREWLQNEARFKGFKRKFLNAHPGMPSYVAADIYNNRAGHTMRKIINSPLFAPTISMADAGTMRDSSPNSAVSQTLGTHNFDKVRWPSSPQIIKIHPLDFDEYTLAIFSTRRFGFNSTKQVRHDKERTELQRQLLSDKGDNEPVIIVKRGKKLHLLEGWHRVMAYLLYLANPEAGAPPSQIDMLKKGDVSHIDFTAWKPVNIRAYIGEQDD